MISGQLPIDPASGDLVEDATAVQAIQSIHNIEANIRAVGGSLADIAKTIVLLSSLEDVGAAAAAVYGQAFDGEHAPPRATYEVAGLPLTARVEIEVLGVPAEVTPQSTAAPERS